MDTYDADSQLWKTGDAGTYQAVRIRWPRSVTDVAGRLRASWELLAQPAEAWWSQHGRRVLRIAALVGGALAFLAFAHIVLSLLSPPSGL